MLDLVSRPSLRSTHPSAEVQGRYLKVVFYFNACKITIPFQLFMYQCLELMNQMLNKMFKISLMGILAIWLGTCKSNEYRIRLYGIQFSHLAYQFFSYLPHYGTAGDTPQPINL